MSFLLAQREVDAIAIAYDELVSYLDVVGQEGSLDDEEMPSPKLFWARDKLRGVLDRYAAYESLVARSGAVIEVPPVRFTYKPTPPSGEPPS